MPQFYYDFLDRFVDRLDFQLLEVDTDSLYMALSRDKFDEVVRSNRKHAFFKEYDRWFPGRACSRHTTDFQLAGRSQLVWNPAYCPGCLDRVRYDKRTLGLFKTEYTGDSFVGLCPKTYFCSGEEGGSKFSCKGLNKHHNTLTLDTYKQVLDTQQSGGGGNVGFKTDGKTMFTYTQTRKSLSYFYIKCIVAADRPTT